MPSGENGVRSLSNAAFFTGPSEIFQFHGSIPPRNFTDPGLLENDKIAESLDLIIFNPSTKSWTKTSQQGDRIVHAELGSAVSVPERGLGFWLGGITYPKPGEPQFIPLDELMRFNTSTREWQVEKTGFDARIRGNTVFVPIGEEGILVNLAGQEYLGSNDKGLRNVNFNEIQVYDIAGHKWYRQRASGDPKARGTGTPGADTSGFPVGRQWPCSIVATVEESANYHIYMFGGLEDDMASERAGLEEVWVLSIPAFKWTLVDTKNFGRWESKCHLGGRSQAILVGGDANSNTEKCTPGLFRVFDLNTLQWTDEYNPNNEEYKPGEPLLESLELKEPENGFTDPELGDIFFPPAPTSLPISSTTPTPTPTGSDAAPEVSESLQPTTSRAPTTVSGEEPQPTSEAEADFETDAPLFSTAKYFNLTSTMVSKTTRLVTGPGTTIAFTGKVTIVSTVSMPQKTVTKSHSGSREVFNGMTPPAPTGSWTTYPSDFFSTRTALPTDAPSSTSSSPSSTSSTLSESEAAVLAEKERLRPYSQTTGIIAGSVLGGLALFGGAAALAVLWWLRARRRKRAERASISRGLLSTVPQAWVTPSPPMAEIITPPRRSRMAWNQRFSKHRGVVEMFELE
ncbi:hypothetical protein ABW19_dt0208139 [Dactylella cylindrospora]|nr:hypothetical protein ABW19_dt0208139 [Dactylella cylindrospora]